MSAVSVGYEGQNTTPGLRGQETSNTFATEEYGHEPRIHFFLTLWSLWDLETLHAQSRILMGAQRLLPQLLEQAAVTLMSMRSRKFSWGLKFQRVYAHEPEARDFRTSVSFALDFVLG